MPTLSAPLCDCGAGPAAATDVLASPAVGCAVAAAAVLLASVASCAVDARPAEADLAWR